MHPNAFLKPLWRLILVSFAVMATGLGEPSLVQQEFVSAQEATQPKAEPAVDKLVPGPWFRAKVGDTLVYRDSFNQKSTLRVTAVDDAKVTLETTGVRAGGQQVPKHTRTEPRQVAPGTVPAMELYGATDATGAKAQMKDLGTETLKIGGRKIVCKVKQQTSSQKGKDGVQPLVRKFWTSIEVPGEKVKVETISPNLHYIDELIEFKRGKP